MDTIFARSSASGKAGIVVFRISGAKSLDVLNSMLNSTADNNSNNRFIPTKMYNRKLYSPFTKQLIDHGLVVYFKAPSSFTGEDVVELHLHGSLAINKLITQLLMNFEGVRIAEPGEFAKRGFLNGKFDLTSAEGLADLIEAETEIQHQQAIRQMEGELEILYESWRSQLLKIIALGEAYIDFPDEEIPISVLEEVKITINTLKNNINLHLQDNRKGERLRNGIKISIIGKPNVGKSSLLNFLMKRDAAIVSDIAGTTRDIIEGHIDLGGYPIILQDTAGIREDSKDVIEQEGIKRSFKSAQNADIIIFMVDNLFEKNDNFIKDLTSNFKINNTIILINKIDLVPKIKQLKLINDIEVINISLKSKIGLELLTDKIIEIAQNIAGISEAPQITRERHRFQLERAIEYLSSCDIEGDLILATEDIRMTIRALSNLTGKISVEEILGEIFSKFCIGK